MVRLLDLWKMASSHADHHIMHHLWNTEAIPRDKQKRPVTSNGGANYIQLVAHVASERV